ncbi:hypothetical protein PS710_02904 [Pseudomonas fluorescens]|uniref:Uncharacterized protein n=1 Tax=Pseudomonas fluorescens TaxID=294 RepID=A0A5E7CID3_PSEFL|nr:hypothetical protein PS710_02904 [Pseudomonas fluorescens]
MKVKLVIARLHSCEIHQTNHSPRQSWPAGNSASLRTQLISARKRSSAFSKIYRNQRFQSFRPMKPGGSSLPVRDRPEDRCASALHFPSKLCTLCNGRSLAEPHSPPGLQVRLHYCRICTKKGHKARRWERDKCFFSCFFLARRFFLRRARWSPPGGISAGKRKPITFHRHASLTYWECEGRCGGQRKTRAQCYVTPRLDGMLLELAPPSQVAECNFG